MKKRLTLWIATVIMALFAVPPEVMSEPAPDKAQVVTVNIDNGTLKELFKAIESQTYYHFSYLEEVLSGQPRVTIRVKKASINKVLDQAFRDSDLQYKIVSNNTIVVSAPDKKTGSTPTIVTGTITDATGEPIVGATIKVKGTNKVAVSNIDGNFSIQDVSTGDAIAITYIGYNPVEIKADGKPLKVTMHEAANDLDEVVVVGYSRTTKRDLISSVSTVKSDQIVNLPVTNVTQGLAGRSPGLIIASSGGGVNQNPSVSIRGGGTPLYVIDGVIRDQSDFTTLSPDDIKEISVLKDASATAIYGSRAANGIIQVTTKTGSEGKTTVDYSFNASWAQPGIWPEKLPVWDRAELFNTARFNDGYEAFYSDDALQKMRDGSDPEHYPNTDWRKAVLRDWAPQMKHLIRLTGGTECKK